MFINVRFNLNSKKTIENIEKLSIDMTWAVLITLVISVINA